MHSSDSRIYATKAYVDAQAGGSEVNDLTAAVTWANVPDANITQSSVTQHQAALSITEGQIPGAAFTNWNTAFGWGNHASAGYLTSETSHADVVVDGDFASNGILKRTAAGVYGIVTDNSANWDTAYGWGDHASGGYLKADGSVALTGTLSCGSQIVQSASSYRTTAASGNGIGFWNSSPQTYGHYMGLASTYGRVTGETTSDYNQYFEMNGGTNRGYVFDTDNVKLFAINPNGVRSSVNLYAPTFYVQADDDVTWSDGTDVLVASAATGSGTLTFQPTGGFNTIDFNLAITANSYDGVAAANLVDKSAAETVSGAWTFSGAGVFSTSLNAVPLARSITATTTTATTDYGIILNLTAGASQTLTLDADPPANAVVFIDNSSGNSWTIAASVSLIWAKDGTTGNRTLADDGVAVAKHRGAGIWIINGSDKLT